MKSESGKDDAVIQTLHAATVPDDCRGNSEGDYIGERVEFSTQYRRFLPPSGDAAVQDIEYQPSYDQAERKVDVYGVIQFEVCSR
jgi:hypothetical protein